jgi:hypothetical protein
MVERNHTPNDGASADPRSAPGDGAGRGPANPLLDAALAYAARGWRVFPVEGKRPLTSHGAHDATTDEATIRAWWRRWPEAGVAVATGAESGLVVLDVDPRSGGDESLRRLEAERGELPRTPVVLTGGEDGGDHYYLAHPGGTVPNRVGLGGYSGLDLKADGGYVVAPPSIHLSGRAYVWEVNAHHDDVPLAPCPQWLLDLAAEGPSGARGDFDPKGWDGVEPEWLAHVLAEDARVRRRFERYPGDLPGSKLSDKSPSGIDLSLASLLAHAGIDGERIEVVLQVSRARAKLPARGASYYRATVGKALASAAEREAMHEDDDATPPGDDKREPEAEQERGPEPKQEPRAEGDETGPEEQDEQDGAPLDEATLQWIRDKLKVPEIEGFEREGTDPVVYRIKLKGRTVEIGRASDVRMQHRFRDAIYDATGRWPELIEGTRGKAGSAKKARKLWEKLTEAMYRIAKPIDVGEGDEGQATAALVTRYVSTLRNGYRVTESDISEFVGGVLDHFRKRGAIVGGGRLYVSIADLTEFANRYGQTPITMQMLARRMSRIGFEKENPKTIRIRDAKGKQQESKRTTLRLWSIERGKNPEMTALIDEAYRVAEKLRREKEAE